MRWDRPVVMGIVNVTPDSFSDGGLYLDPALAIKHGEDLVALGADVIDVGGESTRPGAQPVSVGEELRRVVPVVRELSARPGVVVSIDTTKAAVAAAALDAGATIVNDVSAGRFDPEILSVVADAGAGYIAMHMLGEPRTMQSAPRYDDVVGEVGAFLVERLEVAHAAGIADEACMADPGIGFGKTAEHNRTLLAELPRLMELVGVPILVGASRKSFIGALLGLDVGERDEATLAITVWAFESGAAMVRVHDVRGASQVARLLAEMGRAASEVAA